MHEILAFIRRIGCSLQVLSIVLLCAQASAGAQVAGTGTIQGTVQDATGAVIPNATVTLTEAATQVQRSAQTDGSGVYVFPNITIGNYNRFGRSEGLQHL